MITENFKVVAVFSSRVTFSCIHITLAGFSQSQIVGAHKLHLQNRCTTINYDNINSSIKNIFHKVCTLYMKVYAPTCCGQFSDDINVCSLMHNLFFLSRLSDM